MTTILIYVHGTNGSGKSTLARAVMAAAGGGTGYRPSKSGKEGKAGTTGTSRGVALLGKYETACGGVDGFSPYSHVHEEMLTHSIFPEARVFAEGLLSPGIETCQRFDGYFDRAVFIALNTPVEQCVANVLSRRKRKGTDKVYTPDKLYDKHCSVLRWADRLEGAGLEVKRLEYKEAYSTCLELLGLQEPSIEELL
jgi:hypothetical protein